MKTIEYGVSDFTPEIAAAGALVSGMPNDVYHGFAGISKSGLDLIARSPAHYAHGRKREPSRAMAIGSAIHAALLEPDVFARQYMLLRDVTDRRSAVYKQAAEQFGADNVLTGGEADKVAGMQVATMANHHAMRRLSAPGLSEVSVFATDPETGVLVKCRFDRLIVDGSRYGALDLKKTQDATADAFERSVYNYRYHVQDAFYSDVFLWATGCELEFFEFLAIEEEPPHFSKLYQLDHFARKDGKAKYRAALDAYAECLKTDDWPLPDGGLDVISLPRWAETDDIEG